ncbi:hypothetical protein B566_EDAN007269, partial [Ephemera danica]
MNSVFIASLIILLIAVSRISAVKNKDDLINEAVSLQKPERVARKLISLSKATSKLLQLFNEMKLVLKKIQNKSQQKANNRRLNGTDFSSASTSNYTDPNKSVIVEVRIPDPSMNTTRNASNGLMGNSEYKFIIRQAFSAYKRTGCSKFSCPLIVKNRKMDAKENIIVPASQGFVLRGCGDKQYMLSRIQ